MEQQLSAFERYERGLLLKQVQIFDSALDEFREAATDPRHAGKAHAQIAMCLRSIGRDAEAVVEFCNALKTATFSSKERMHILYLLGQTLESLGRYAETLEIYRWLRREDPDFQDVGHRIKHLCSGVHGPIPDRPPTAQALVGEILNSWGQVRPLLVSLLGQMWESLGQYVETLHIYHWVQKRCPSLRNMAYRIMQQRLTPERYSPTPSTGRSAALRRGKVEKRQHARVAVRLRSQFSSKTRMVAGEGELRDLSPWGCRVTSPVGVPVGVALECCIFPQDERNPFTVDEATVRWSRPQEFGLAFTKVRPGVQQQIAQMCRTRVPLS
jgi:PilZ domain-containing protein